jgi:hypothetical protein
LIQQPQYTQTTTKYNFPQLTLEDNILPQQFTELSLRTIKNINPRTAVHQSQITTEETSEPQEILPILKGQTILQLKTIPLTPKPDETPVIAVDVASIRLGETDTGILLALRAATTWKQRSSAYRYLRFGPFPIHITDQNQHDILSLFNEHSSAMSQQRNTLFHQLTSMPDLNQTQTRITALLEKWLQTQIAAQTRNSIILLDGNLTTTANDQNATATTRLLQTARNHHNAILALTKITRLRLNGHNITDLIQRDPKPSLLQLDNYQPSNSIRQQGSIYVAKLNHSPYTFRLDTDADISSQEAVEAVEHLIANDLITDGYPETLRLAHIYSTFTANEVIGIQRFLAQAHGIKIAQRPNIRRLLFGPYGTRHES